MVRLRICSLFLCLSLALFAEEAAVTEKVFEAPADTSKSIQPRNEGASWLYRGTYFEAERKIFNGSSRQDVIETIEIDGVECYKVRLTIDGRSFIERLSGETTTAVYYSYSWEYYNENGSYHYLGEADYETEIQAPTSLEQFELSLPFPAAKGLKFELSLPFPAVEGLKYVVEKEKYEIVDVELNVKVPAGEFPCTVYERRYGDDPDYLMTRQRLYMSPGVGLVRLEDDHKVDGKWQLALRDDLIKYDLKLKVPEKRLKPRDDGRSVK